MLDLLVDFLPKRYPDRFKRTADNELQNIATGDVFKLDHPDLDPLEVSSLLVQVPSSALLLWQGFKSKTLRAHSHHQTVALFPDQLEINSQEVIFLEAINEAEGSLSACRRTCA